jgi:hypothetical protein
MIYDSIKLHVLLRHLCGTVYGKYLQSSRLSKQLEFRYSKPRNEVFLFFFANVIGVSCQHFSGPTLA